MKKLLNAMLCLVLVLGLAGCGKKKGNDTEKTSGESGNTTENKPVEDHSASELKELAKKAGYVVNDYLACYVGLTEEQMEGFTVDIQKEATEVGSYCVIVAVNEDYAKQACETLQSEYTNCIRSGRAIVFPEYNAASEVVKKLTSIVEGRPVNAGEYHYPGDDEEDETVEDNTTDENNTTTDETGNTSDNNATEE